VHTQPADLDASYRSLAFWLDSLPGPLLPRPALDGDQQADVVIIGAGYTGLWTAWYLSQHAPQLDIALVEAEIAGFGASGRNGGWCSAYLSGIDSWLDDPAQRAGALRLQRLMFDSVGEVGRVCTTAGIDAHFAHDGHVEVAVRPAQLQRVQRELAYYRELGLGEDFIALDAAAVAARISIDGALGGLYTPHCAAIHPARLARGLAQALVQRGVRLYEQSAVTAFQPGSVSTAQGRIRARQVVLATEGYGCKLPGLARKLIPIHSMMVATAPLDSRQLAATGLGRRAVFNNSDHLVTYGQLTADRRLAFGCRGTYGYANELMHFDAAQPRFDFVRGKLLELFPGLAGVEFTHAWGGCMGVARSLRPCVSFDPSSGLAWAGGYFGNGVAASNLAGRSLADLLLGRDSERLRTPWINPARERGLSSRLWEPEPLRWLGIHSRGRWMQWTDAAERRESALAPGMNWLLGP
jgi:glycine/D-amino acid oxidase-like deaminating enzyme